MRTSTFSPSSVREILSIGATPIPWCNDHVIEFFFTYRGPVSGLDQAGKRCNPSARAAGIDKEIGYRWLRESYLRFRGGGASQAKAAEALTFPTSRHPTWETALGEATGRRHLQVNAEDGNRFWATFALARIFHEALGRWCLAP